MSGHASNVEAAIVNKKRMLRSVQAEGKHAESAAGRRIGVWTAVPQMHLDLAWLWGPILLQPRSPAKR